MAVPTLITDLSTTAASNSPSGSENVFPNLDDYLRSQAAFLASIRDNSGNGWVSPYLTNAITVTTSIALTSSTAALSITQSGTGPAISVIGPQASFRAYSNDAVPFYLPMLKARGASGAPLVVNSGDSLGMLQFYGYTGTADAQAAHLYAATDGTPSATSMPGRMVFATTPAASLTPVERMRIDSNGDVGIGQTNPVFKLDVLGSANFAGGAITLNPASFNVTISPTGTGQVTLSPAGGLTIAPVIAGTINNVAIGGTTRAAGSFTTVAASTSVTAATLSATGDIQATSYNGGPLAGLRNRVINGGMQVAQRGSATISSNVQVYGGCDRWVSGAFAFTTVSGTISQGGSLGLANGTVTGFVQQIVCTTTGSGNLTFIQRIEASNSSDLSGEYVTVSVSLYQNTGSTITPTLNLYKPTALDNHTATTFLFGTNLSLPTGVMTKFTWSVQIGASDANLGLALIVNLPCGAVTSKTFQISDVQVEIGSVATPFEQRPIGMELALCQRYFEQLSIQVIAYMQSTTAGKFVLPYTAQKRSAASVTYVSGNLLQQSLASTFASGNNANLGTITLTQYQNSVNSSAFDFTSSLAGTGSVYAYLFGPTLAISAEL